MTDDKSVLKPQLWVPRPVDETIAIYADWAATYDAEVTARGYRTPARVADALADHAQLNDTVLDFGCGTGLSGMALHKRGFTDLHGTDVTAEMLDRAQATGLYHKTWLGAPGALNFGRGTYPVIAAVGVISLGAGPPDLIALLLAKLDAGGLLILSFNGPTLADDSYADALGDALANGSAQVIFRENGPHLDDVGMTSDVIILRRL